MGTTYGLPGAVAASHADLWLMINLMVGSPFRLENRKTIKSISNECRGVFPGEYQNSVRPKLPLLTECQKSVQPARHPKTEYSNSIRKLQDRKQSIKIVSGNSGAKVRVSKNYQKSIKKYHCAQKISKEYQKSISGTSVQNQSIKKVSKEYQWYFGTLFGTLCWIPRNLGTLLRTIPRTLLLDTWSCKLGARTLFLDTPKNGRKHFI